MDLTLTKFTEIVNSIKPFNGSHAVIIDNSGKLIIHSNKNYVDKVINQIPNFLDPNHSQVLITKLAENSKFYEEVTTKSGEYMVFSQPIMDNNTKFGWNLTLFVPKSELLTDLNINIVVIIVILIILIVAIWVISENIGKSVSISFEKLKIFQRVNSKTIS